MTFSNSVSVHDSARNYEEKLVNFTWLLEIFFWLGILI